jgi:hypothetical protein
MAQEIENLSSTEVSVTETRVDRTTVDSAVDGTPNVTAAGLNGLHGVQSIATTEVVGKFCRIQFIVASTITTLEGHQVSGTWTSITYPANFVLNGYFTRVKLATGNAVLTNV